MESFIFAVSAVAPIILLVLTGYFLKKLGFMNDKFAKDANKLVFRIFMPVMLFLNIYRIKDIASMDLGFMIYVVIAIFVIFFVSIPLSFAIAGKKDRRGVLIQAAFRSGYSLIGIPLARSLYGEEGEIAASLLAAGAIPVFNVLAVICLSAMGGDEEGKSKKPSVIQILLDIIKNPLIIGIAAALVAIAIRSIFVKVGISFRLSDVEPLMTALQYISNLAVPTALLVLGAQFELSAVASLKKEIIFGTIFRTVIVPTFALGIAYFLFDGKFTPAHYASFVAVFATPVAVPSVPMVQEMGGDTTLAGQLVVWSTLASALTLFIFTYLLKLGGAF